MDFQQAALATCGAALAFVWYKRHRALSISDIPGPKNPSWIYGHLWWWQHEEPNAVEKSLLEGYGTVVRWNGALGEERLWITDPKAINHMLQTSSYLYRKPPHTKAQREVFVGRGLGYSEGDAHKRQRKAMVPAFGLVEAKNLYPCFAQCSNLLADKWHEIISNADSGKAVDINVSPWFDSATLDAIGAGAFDYDFGGLENTDNKLTKSYKNLMYFPPFLLYGIFQAFQGTTTHVDVLGWTPSGFAAWCYERGQSPGLVKMRENRKNVQEVAAKLIEDKRQEIKDGTSQKDVLTLLMKANSTLKPEWRLSDKELIAQVRTIMFAGHETTSKTMTYALWELAKNRNIQERLREEITEKLRQIRSTGRDDFTADDFDSMPYLLAVGKETLRVHPIANEIPRVPNDNIVLPLSTPVVGISGKVYKELPVPAGTVMVISPSGYNLDKDLWGPDAYEFRPERWLDMSKKPELPAVGVYGNLTTFSGGPRSCIGWRFAVVEMHTFLVTLIRQFDFSLPDGREIKWMRINIPVVVGEEHKGPQLPLKVIPLGNE